MNQGATAVELLRQIDETGDLNTLRDYMTYAYFDARPFPNLMAFLESQGITPREPRKIPYQCRI